MFLKRFKESLVYDGNEVQLHLLKYVEPKNNALTMELLDGDPYTTCSINIEHKLKDEDLICIKDYSENQGILNFLLENNVVTEVLGTIGSGYVDIPVCRLNLDNFIEVE